MLSKAELEQSKTYWQTRDAKVPKEEILSLHTHIEEQQKLIDRLAEWVRPHAQDAISCEGPCDHGHCRRVRKARALWEEVDRG